jgi:catechol 2,3-dioxygenase-like lactoylglutathione lyase family enzyme
VVKGRWNYALKVTDLEAAASFYVDLLDARVLWRTAILGCNSILVKMGDARILLFDRAPYEAELGLNLPEGFLHDVYEVDDFEAHYGRLKAAGTKFLGQPQVIETELDRRKIVFFETPTGIRTEVMQVLHHKQKA